MKHLETFFHQKMHHLFYHSKKPVVSTAIFIDDDPIWRPNCFEQKHPFNGNIYHQFFFDTVKLLDYRGKEEELKKMFLLWFFLLN